MKKPIAGKERKIFSAYGRTILLQDFTFPDSRTDEFFIVAHPNSVLILPITADRQIIALRQFRCGINDFIIEIPGGGVELRKSAEEAAGEELLEETGYRVEKLARLPNCVLEPAAFRFEFICFLATGCLKSKEPCPGKNEIFEVKLFSFKEWNDMIFAGAGRVKIDCKSICATFLALPFLKKIGLELEI